MFGIILLVGVLVLGVIISLCQKNNVSKETREVKISNKEELEELERNKQYLLDVANQSIADLQPLGLTEERAKDLLDEVALCSTEDDYLRFIDKCDKIGDDLVGARVVNLRAKLEEKKLGKNDAKRVEMIEKYLEKFTSTEDLELIEENIRRLRGKGKEKKEKTA